MRRDRANNPRFLAALGEWRRLNDLLGYCILRNIPEEPAMVERCEYLDRIIKAYRIRNGLVGVETGA